MDNSLNISDLEYIVNLIDLAAKRSCLVGDELLTVGALRENFIKVAKDSTNAEVSLQDFSIVLNLIEAITRRGGLTGEDILPVAILRQKIITLLEQAQQKINEEKENLGDNNG